MILISLLLALALDRMVTRTKYWQSAVWVRAGLRKFNISAQQDEASRRIWLYLFVPALVLALLETYVLGGFLTFIEQTIVLFITISCTRFRDIYKFWIQAAHREDAEACDLYERQLHLGLLGKRDKKSTPDDGTRMQRLLLLANFRYFGAVILFFIFFGAPGALFYMCVREAHQYYREHQHAAARVTHRLLFALEWLPARATTLGYLIVGHFSKAAGVWLETLTNTTNDTADVLWSVAREAEVIDDEGSLGYSKAAALAHVQAGVRLAKRNIIFLLVVTSLLTLGGWLA
ncbi:regulatory signaling modulator protein AmpE [Alteromonas confluentis]|uniref:Regulatory signaling modulator protein AmpE n=1 Tax=Alteromonas confluentis TaxID=1656094 RepID=A0A1E7ZD27_9ALTE|nr:regulatory signaling modulator protein AmpE [Alteromonas confluentis]OFC71354.1 hypothetical protein BFC18_09385 [Alteromonas confluentis]